MSFKHLSDKTRHFFHGVSNIRPIVWIVLYVVLMPLFAFIYWMLPDGQFRIPDGGTVGYGSWLYYSIVTITTLGFGDYTPAHGWSQAVTAIEVMCGLVTLGFFINAVGAMKSEIDVESEIEKQRLLKAAAEKEKLRQSVPAVVHVLNMYLNYCYAVTTPQKYRKEMGQFNPDFEFKDMMDMYHPVGLAFDKSDRPAIERLLQAAARTSLCIDALQQRVDLGQWPDLLEDCFKFVADYQIFSLTDNVIHPLGNSSMERSDKEAAVARLISEYDPKNEEEETEKMSPLLEIYNFVKSSGILARRIELGITQSLTD